MGSFDTKNESFDTRIKARIEANNIYISELHFKAECILESMFLPHVSSIIFINKDLAYKALIQYF